MWGRFWAARFWAPVFWAKVGAAPPEGAFGNDAVGLAPKRTFTTEGVQLGGGGPFG